MHSIIDQKIGFQFFDLIGLYAKLIQYDLLYSMVGVG